MSNPTTPAISTTPAADLATTDQTRDLAANFAAQLASQGTTTPGFASEAAGISARDWALFKDPVLHNERLEAIRQKKGYIIDMDGVIYHVSSVLFMLELCGYLPYNRVPNCCLVQRNLLNSFKRTTKSSSS